MRKTNTTPSKTGTIPCMSGESCSRATHKGNNLAQGEQSGPKEANPPLYSSQDNHVILKQVIAILLGSIFSQISSNKSTKYSLLIYISDLQNVCSKGSWKYPRPIRGACKIKTMLISY